MRTANSANGHPVFTRREAAGLRSPSSRRAKSCVVPARAGKGRSITGLELTIREHAQAATTRSSAARRPSLLGHRRRAGGPPPVSASIEPDCVQLEASGRSCPRTPPSGRASAPEVPRAPPARLPRQRSPVPRKRNRYCWVQRSCWVRRSCLPSCWRVAPGWECWSPAARSCASAQSSALSLDPSARRPLMTCSLSRQRLPRRPCNCS